jgi:hypothetical protein
MVLYLRKLSTPAATIADRLDDAFIAFLILSKTGDDAGSHRYLRSDRPNPAQIFLLANRGGTGDNLLRRASEGTL